MSGVQISDAKAPFVMFERRSEEDREASIAAGHFVGRDVDYALVTPHGSRDQIERVVSEWFKYLADQVREGRFDKMWLKAYTAAYEDWCEGKETPLSGTSILNWPVLSPSQVRLLQELKILTVEVLAQANEETIKRLGMGGRTLVDKAKDFLSVASGSGKVVEEVGKLRQTVDTQSAQIAQLLALNAALQARLPEQGLEQNQAPAPVQGASDSIGAADLLDPPPAMRKL